MGTSPLHERRHQHHLPNDEFPDLRTIIFPPTTIVREEESLDEERLPVVLRRSPRKNAASRPNISAKRQHQQQPQPQLRQERAMAGVETTTTTSAMSDQRQLSSATVQPSPSKKQTATTKTKEKRLPLGTISQGKMSISVPVNAPTSVSVLDNVPKLSSRKQTLVTKHDVSVSVSAGSERMTSRPATGSLKLTHVDSLLLPLSRMAVGPRDSEDEGEDSDSQVRNSYGDGKAGAKAVMSLVTQAARNRGREGGVRENPDRKPTRAAVAATNRFVLDEARCDEDLVDSDADAQNDVDEEDTDLSGFIVDDDAEISFHDATTGAEDEDDEDHTDSEEERRRVRRRAEVQKPKRRRRLQRGRKVIESEDEEEGGDELLDAFDGLKLDGSRSTRAVSEAVEVIDLVSPEHRSIQETSQPNTELNMGPSRVNLFDKLQALRLSPPKTSRSLEIPTKSHMGMPSSIEELQDEEKELNNNVSPKQDRYATPPATPPRSPSKLKSPSKLMSPSKRGDAIQQSPHRQSMDAFWDLNEINEWHDQFSPKKAPLGSPRKNRLAAFDLWSDAEEEEGERDDSFEAINETSDSLPSPCESPSKPRPRAASPIKAEKQRLLAEKKAKEASKKDFEARKESMALDLLHALDEHVTKSQISKLSASTGGVQIIWSKTLRSTAGRANWRRTVTKATGSPVKGRSEEHLPGTTVQHFANIELATKVIDRPERLISTLAHEFCHLANFMVSGIRDQPHGASFQSWARKVTSWMKSQDDVAAWRDVEVTTKHGYVIEWKYLWLCVGRKDRNPAMDFLNLEDDDGCGAEYGRHSKSIDTDTQRCGRCKGMLMQVRPNPRMKGMGSGGGGNVSPAKLNVQSEIKTKTKSTRSSSRKSPVKKEGGIGGIGGGVGNDKGGRILSETIEVIELSD